MQFRKSKLVIMRTCGLLLVSSVMGTGAVAGGLEFVWRATVKIQPILARNFSWGPGSRQSGLATMQDMTLFEQDWGGRQATFNGSGVTVNKLYPVTDGSALTLSARVGAEFKQGKSRSGGAEALVYVRDGDPVVGRVFGPPLPFGNFIDREDKLLPAHSSIQLGRIWYQTQEPWGNIRLNFGQIDSDILPELARKDNNFMRLGSLIYRPPTNTSTFFGKDDRKLYESRGPLFGFTSTGDYKSAHGPLLHFDVVVAHTNPTPITNISRTVQGGRLNAPIGKANLGFSYFHQQGSRKPEIESERQSLWAIDASFPLGHGAIFGAIGASDYSRGKRQTGAAIVLGYRQAWGKDGFWSAQFQSVDARYDLIGTHKPDNYPSNWQGFMVNARSSPQNGIRWFANLYGLRQKKSGSSNSSEVWGDSFFPNLLGSSLGTITVLRTGAESSSAQGATWSAYFENAHFDKDGSSSNRIDKSVSNIAGFYTFPVRNVLVIGIGMRYVWSRGQWQSMRFDHGQFCPELGIEWKFRKDSRLWLRSVHYAFKDHNSVAQGKNDWFANQLILDVIYKF